LRFPTIVLAPPRAALVARIERRFEAMIDAGALAEVEAMMQAGLPPDAPILKAVGAPELAQLVQGNWSQADAIEAAVIATRQYAKRQTTWLRRQIIPDLVINAQHSQKTIDEIFAFIRVNALTP
jgi:tRNA dimethylallyltransferase